MSLLHNARQLRREVIRTRSIVADALHAVANSKTYGRTTDQVLQRLLHIERYLGELFIYLSKPNRVPHNVLPRLAGLMAETQQHARTISLVMRKAGRAVPVD
jgi:hypothetical protein